MTKCHCPSSKSLQSARNDKTCAYTYTHTSIIIIRAKSELKYVKDINQQFYTTHLYEVRKNLLMYKETGKKVDCKIMANSKNWEQLNFHQQKHGEVHFSLLIQQNVIYRN